VFCAIFIFVKMNACLENTENVECVVLPNEILSLLTYHAPDAQTLFKFLTTSKAFGIPKAQKLELMDRFSTPFETKEEDEITKGYKLPNGTVHGKYQVFWKCETIPETLIRERNYVCGVKHGLQTIWYHPMSGEAPRIKKKVHYVNGEKEGIIGIWHGGPNILKNEGTFFKGKKHGLWREWHENGNIRIEKTFRFGRSIEKKMWYKNGHIRFEEIYKTKRRAFQRKWHSNGHVESEGIFFDNEKKGLWKEWYSNGQMRSIGAYQHGARHGPWKEWHENGDLERCGSYILDLPEGLWKTWYNCDGEKRNYRTGRYHKGMKYGPWKIFHDDGSFTVIMKGMMREDLMTEVL
jgi:antitoxin component YwqK of YwqJK toxin-antitoxin module